MRLLLNLILYNQGNPWNPVRRSSENTEQFIPSLNLKESNLKKSEILFNVITNGFKISYSFCKFLALDLLLPTPNPRLGFLHLCYIFFDRSHPKDDGR